MVGSNPTDTDTRDLWMENFNEPLKAGWNHITFKISEGIYGGWGSIDWSAVCSYRILIFNDYDTEQVFYLKGLYISNYEQNTSPDKLNNGGTTSSEASNGVQSWHRMQPPTHDYAEQVFYRDLKNGCRWEYLCGDGKSPFRVRDSVSFDIEMEIVSGSHEICALEKQIKAVNEKF
jgi:hypothetical protein